MSLGRPLESSLGNPEGSFVGRLEGSFEGSSVGSPDGMPREGAGERSVAALLSAGDFRFEDPPPLFTTRTTATIPRATITASMRKRVLRRGPGAPGTPGGVGGGPYPPGT
jgi:hypothetical protein